jgi:hypothetical protein
MGLWISSFFDETEDDFREIVNKQHKSVFVNKNSDDPENPQPNFGLYLEGLHELG